MKFSDMAPGFIGATTGIGATLCCVLPLALVATGIGSGAFMTVTMQYRPILYPLGLIGLGTAVVLYVRRKRACDRLSCRMQGKWINAALLAFSALLMAAVTYVDFFVQGM